MFDFQEFEETFKHDPASALIKLTLPVMNGDMKAELRELQPTDDESSEASNTVRVILELKVRRGRTT